MFQQTRTAPHAFAAFSGGYENPAGYGFSPADVPHAPGQAPSGFMFQPQQPAPAPSVVGAWDPAHLANAFNTVSLTPPPSSSEWYTDSGASSHMAANAGDISIHLQLLLLLQILLSAMVHFFPSLPLVLLLFPVIGVLLT